MQSHMGFIHLLPALPDMWEEGSVEGLCAKGGFEVDIRWNDGKLVEAVVKSNNGGRCELLYGDYKLTFGTQKGSAYRISTKNGRLTSYKL